jgi:hypothetical protein
MSQAAAVITLDDRRGKASEAEDVQVAIIGSGLNSWARSGDCVRWCGWG